MSEILNGAAKMLKFKCKLILSDMKIDFPVNTINCFLTIGRTLDNKKLLEASASRPAEIIDVPSLLTMPDQESNNASALPH